jgi:glycosyltransferase involved in cell wall biosynthesis
MIDATVILPVTSANEQTFNYALTTIKSCHDTTKGRIFVMDNNSHGSSWTEVLKKECEAMGVRYEYFPQQFSTSKFFNMGLDQTSGKYIAYGSSDLIFHTPSWLENIIELWEEQPEWWCLAPFQLGSEGMSCGRSSATLEKRIVRCHNVACGICVMKRENGYRWDEQFPFQVDSDQVYHAEANKLKMGYCCNARVEHLIGRIRGSIDQTLHNEEPVKCENKLLRDKWGARYGGAP